jgi:hypothetical protein
MVLFFGRPLAAEAAFTVLISAAVLAEVPESRLPADASFGAFLYIL